MDKSKVARRSFLRNTLAASAAVPLAAIPHVLRADSHRLREDDPTAVALGYKHDANDVDIAKFPRRATAEGQKQLCSNCKLFQAGSEEWGGCSIFPGKEVNANGWCNAWVEGCCLVDCSPDQTR